MELKQAMEVATEDIDVRPGFVGDVMARARRRHTRKLVTITAVVALIAGVTTGVVLTRTPGPDPAALDPRLVAATGGDLASDRQVIDRSLEVWRNAQTSSRQGEAITDFSQPSHVYWAGSTADGPAVLIVQPVEVNNSPDLKLLVGVVAMDGVVDREVVHDRAEERGIYRFGRSGSTNVVLGLGRQIFWSSLPVRDGDGRLTRDWQAAGQDRSGVAVVSAPPTDRPVFVRSGTAPAPDDFTLAPLRAKQDLRQGVFVPHPGLGWTRSVWATDDHRDHPQLKSMLAHEDMQKQRLVDYVVDDSAWSRWQVRAWLPDGRFASVFEANGESYAAVYRADGTFEQGLLGSVAVKGAPLPVRVRLPDGMGTIVADFDHRIGPDRRLDAWVAPQGVTTARLERPDGGVDQVTW